MVPLNREGTDVTTTTEHIIQTDATPEEFAELAERLRAEYPEWTITHRSSDRYTCPSWCTLEHGHADWATRTSDGFPIRSHQGRMFGPFLVGAEQTLDGTGAPNVVLSRSR